MSPYDLTVMHHSSHPLANPVIAVHAIFRHYHPVLTGVGERFRRYAPGLLNRGVELIVETGLTADSSDSLRSDPLVNRHPTESISAQQIDLDILHGALGRIDPTKPSPFLWQASTGSIQFLRALRSAKRQTKAKALYVGTMVEPRSVEISIIRRVKRAANDWLFRNTYDHFIASGTIMAEIFEQRGIPPQRISVIPSGVDTQRFCPVSSEEKLQIRSGLGLPPHARVLLFVGGIVPRKGVIQLIHAWKQHLANSPHQDDVLVLIGPRERQTFVTEEQQNELSCFQKEIDVATATIAPQNIRFIESMDQIEKAYQAADLFAFPSEKEGMPNAVMEAMACGLPVLTSKFIGFPKTEFGSAGNEFEFLPLSTHEMAIKIGSLFNDTDNSIQLGHKAREWAKKNLDLQVTLDRYAEVYHHLAIP